MMETTTEGGLVLSTDKVAMPPNPTVDDIVLAVRHIYSRPMVHKVVIEAGEPIQVVWHRPADGDLGALPSSPEPEAILSNIQLGEMPPIENPHEALLKGMMRVNARGLYPSFVFMSNGRMLRKWLGIEGTYPMHNRVAGMEVILIESILPDHCVVILGTHQRAASPNEAVYALKVNMVRGV